MEYQVKIIEDNNTHVVEGFPSAIANEICIDGSGATAGRLTLFREFSYKLPDGTTNTMRVRLLAIPSSEGSIDSINLSNRLNYAIPLGLQSDRFVAVTTNLVGKVVVIVRGY